MPSLATLAQDTGLPDAATHPAVVWTVVVCACISAVILAAAKLVGPLGEAMEKRRQMKQRAEDARVTDLSTQVDHLAGRVYTLELGQRRQDEFLIAHARWDYEIAQAAIAAGLEVTSPPPLRPPLDAP